MKINWKVRFQNKVWLYSFIGYIVSFVYTMLAAFDIFPEITESTAMKIVEGLIFFLSTVGIIVDPTTEGLNDSDRAMSYGEPYSEQSETQG